MQVVERHSDKDATKRASSRKVVVDGARDGDVATERVNAVIARVMSVLGYF